jgi:hypothetical protein
MFGREVSGMDVQTYCHDMGLELSGWEKELKDVLNVVATFPDKDKEIAAAKVSALRGLVDDLTGKIERLKNECPLDWSAVASQIQREADALKKRIETEAIWDADHIAGGYVGG